MANDSQYSGRRHFLPLTSSDYKEGAHVYKKTVTEDVLNMVAFINHALPSVNNLRKSLLRTSQDFH